METFEIRAFDFVSFPLTKKHLVLVQACISRETRKQQRLSYYIQIRITLFWVLGFLILLISITILHLLQSNTWIQLVLKIHFVILVIVPVHKGDAMDNLPDVTLLRKFYFVHLIQCVSLQIVLLRWSYFLFNQSLLQHISITKSCCA